MFSDSHIDMSWMDRRVDSVPSNNWLYRLSCVFLLRKRLTYKELYLILVRLNEKRLGEEKSKERCFNEILKIYKHNNNNELPKEIKKWLTTNTTTS